MTPRQIELSRHALGLPNKECRSYRNRFIAGPGHHDYAEWMAMVDEGAAKKLAFQSSSLFYLTRAGAEQTLQLGEKLDPEDFGSRRATAVAKP